MRKKSSLSVIIFFLFVCLNIQTARAQKLDWVRTTDSYSKQGAMIARDANDNVVSCGYLIHDRIFTRKWDKLGNFLWEKESVSGVFNYRERPTWITTDNSNNIITLGYRYYGTSYQQPNALVILKYAPDGTLLFKKTLEGVFGLSLRCELDPAGNIYIGVAATITGQSDFGFNLIKLDPNGNILFISIHNFGSYYSVNNMRYRNGYIALTGITSLQGYSFNCTTALFNANGNYLWGVVSNSLYAGIDVEVDNNGNVYVVNLDYASGLDSDIKVTKYSVTGNVLFTYIYDKNSHNESPSRINIQPDGNFVISGVCTTPITGLETFKLSSAGSLMWEAFYSAPFPDIPQLYFMATNPNTSDVFLTGTTSISGNPASIFTIKYDSFGNESWVVKYDSTATRGMGLAIASDGNVFVVGLNWWTVLHYLNGNIPNTCSIPANLNTTGITSASAAFSWSAVSGAVSYNVRYRVVGTTTWTTATTTTSSFNAAGMTANSKYEWQVQTVCSGGSSLFTASATFTTAVNACSNIALGKTTTASSSSGSNKPNLVVDGNASTFWRSSSGSIQYLQVDFGTSTYNYSQVTIKWRSTRHAKSFQIRVSNNASFSTFTTVFNTTTGSGGNQTISLSGAPRTERYIRLYMTKVNSSYYAVNEFEICGFLSSALKSQNFGDLGVKESTIQAEPELYQNYPNPFNQITSIQFNLPEDVHASLRVYNMFGEEVAMLLNENHCAGVHTVIFDATNLPSGVYIAILQTNEVKRVQRLLLIR